ncbi:MAG: iron-sulfur cluster insertion protein ErpA [Aigarchaeota archaeon]|nr:iron-sulfur cluster insertion protein ErpA [Aigarchaeota archaeon]MDW8092442.1 iron-sulfur cluster insertion protein ErpA [Nitrososphaerota archaeon]
MINLSLTERAVQKLKEMMREEGNEGLGLRIFISGGGCGGYKYGMALDDKVYEDDYVVQQDGVRVIVDQFSAKFMQGSQIDYLETLMGAGFVVKNPNVTSTCGCGHSFSVNVPANE